jgi:D-lyxose ketol-isomerase
MKRSEINFYLKESVDFFGAMKFSLPRFAYWSPAEWKGQRAAVADIVECSLGWDITDFGSGDFCRVGLINFNLRNGTVNQTRKTYCEKTIIVKESQVTPLHTHRSKIEDIINRGGGELVIQLFQANRDFQTTKAPVTVKIDSMPVTIAGGDEVSLPPGASICLEPGVLHMFYGKPGAGTVLVGEVSTVNDDRADNVFLGGNPRFPLIDEDEEPLFLLVNDYQRYIQD